MSGRCIVVLPKVGTGDVTRELQDAIRHHEWGRCNAWDPQHSDPFDRHSAAGERVHALTYRPP